MLGDIIVSNWSSSLFPRFISSCHSVNFHIPFHIISVSVNSQSEQRNCVTMTEKAKAVKWVIFIGMGSVNQILGINGRA